MTLFHAILASEALASSRLDGETFPIEDTPMPAPTPVPIRTEVVNVTPELAQAWLTRNHVNRAVRPRRVAQYAAAMDAGQWTLNNDAICVSADGDLLNGQHRLRAVVQHGQGVPMLVMHGVSAEAMRHMDRGATRTLGDVLRLAGMPSASATGAVLRMIYLIQHDAVGTVGGTTSLVINDDDLVALLHRHPEVRDSVRMGMRAYSVLGCPVTPLGVVHWLITQENGTDVADLYLEALTTRANEPRRSPIHAVANRLSEVRRAGQKPTNWEYLYLLVKGFNYWVTGREAVKMQMKPKTSDTITSLPPIAKWSHE